VVERPIPTSEVGVNLADQLNRTLDRIIEEAGRLVRRGSSGSGRAFECIFGVPPVYVGQVIDFSARRTVSAVGQTATELGLSGPVIFPRPLEFPPKRAIETAQTLTLAHAWRTGWANDPQVRAARAAQAVVSERLPLARSQLLPQAQLGAQRIDNSLTREGLNTLQQRQEIFDRYESGNVSLQVRQPLFRAQQVIAVTQALAFVDESMATLEREMQNFSVRLTVAYFEALLARDQMDLIDTQRRFLEQAVAAERKALMAGFGTRTDVDAAAAKLDLNQAQALEARQQQEMARRQLEAYVAHPIGELAKLNISSLERLTEIDADLGDWVLRAQAASPEVRQLLAQREASRQEMKKARAGHLPTVDFVAQVQRSRSENTLSPQAQFTNRSMGVQLNLPLYSGGFVNSQTRQASAEVQRLDEQIDAAKADLGVRVHKEFRGVVEGRARVKALEVAARSADVALDSARKSVKAGIRTTVDVLNAEQSRMQVMRDLAQARYSTIVSLVRLHALTGGADEAFMTRIDSALQVQQ
jgi:TolC family type I secretion outer membrane protein